MLLMLCSVSSVHSKSIVQRIVGVTRSMRTIETYNNNNNNIFLSHLSKKVQFPQLRAYREKD